MGSRQAMYTVIFAIVPSDGLFAGGKVETVRAINALEAKGVIEERDRCYKVLAVIKGVPHMPWKRQ